MSTTTTTIAPITSDDSLNFNEMIRHAIDVYGNETKVVEDQDQSLEKDRTTEIQQLNGTQDRINKLESDLKTATDTINRLALEMQQNTYMNVAGDRQQNLRYSTPGNVAQVNTPRDQSIDATALQARQQILNQARPTVMTGKGTTRKWW